MIHLTLALPLQLSVQQLQRALQRCSSENDSLAAMVAALQGEGRGGVWHGSLELSA